MNMKVHNVNPAGDMQSAAQVVNTGTQEVSMERPQATEPLGTVEESEPIRNEAFLNRVLTEKKTAQEELRRMKEENKSFRENELKRQDNYKMLVEEKDKELIELRSKYQSREDLIVKSTKASNLKKELSKLGCGELYAEKLVNMPSSLQNITYDDGTGITTGQAEVARSLSEEFAPLFGKVDVGINQSATAGIPEMPTLDGYRKIPASDQEGRAKYREALYKAEGIERK